MLQNLVSLDKEQPPDIIILISEDNKLVKKIKGFKKKIKTEFQINHFSSLSGFLEDNISRNIEEISVFIIDDKKNTSSLIDFIRDFSTLNIIILVQLDQLKSIYENFSKLNSDLLVRDPDYDFVKVLEYKIEKCINSVNLEKKFSIYENYLQEMVFSPMSDLNIEIAERTLAIEALHESEKRFQDILKNSRDIAYRLNFFTGKYDYLSASFEKLTGYPVKDVLDKGFLQIAKRFHPEDLKKFKKYFNNIEKRISSDNNLQEIEYRFLCKNGEYKWFSDSRIAIGNADGTGAIIGNIRDITERKQVSEKLRDSEEIAKALLNNPLDSVLIINLEGTILDLNQSMATYLGKSIQELTAKNINDFIPVDMLNSVNKKSDEVFKNKKIVRFEAEYDEHWFDHSIYPIIVNDEIMKVVIFTRDITARKLAEIEKSEANRILDQIFHSSPSGMCIIDKGFEISSVNKSFLELFQLENKSVVGTNLMNLIGGETSDKHIIKINKILNGISFIEYESKINVNNKELDFHISAVPFYSKDEEIIGSICNFQDVTEERNLQKIIIQIIQDERQRIGQELHDGLGQNLTAIAFFIELLHQKMKNVENFQIDDVVKIENLMKNAIRQTRSISRMLYPVEMEKNGLNAAIENLIGTFEKISEVNFRLEQDRNFLIADHNVANHLFYIVREAVNSSIKHGNAKNITIKLKLNYSDFVLIVDDDGSDFENMMSKNREMSLRIMEYRSKMIGAELITEKKEKSGYCIRVLF